MLRDQLLVWLLVPLALLLLADAYLSYRVALRFARDAYDRSLIEVAHELALHVRLHDGKLALELPEAARRVLLNDPTDRIYFSIADEQGKRIAGDPIPDAAGALTRGPRAELLYNVLLAAESVRVVEMKLEEARPGARPHGIIRVAETEGKRRELAHEILLSVIAPQLLLILLAGSIVWLGVRRGLSPLLRLQRAVAARSPHDRSQVAVPDVPGEVRPLLDAINGLLQRLDAALTLENRFVADAAHQLKTPVAALQAQIELALRCRDLAQMRAGVDTIRTGLDRLARLVSQLLSLARNEPDAAASVRLAPLDLNALALEAASRWVPEALKRSIDLGFEGTEAPLTIAGDSERLHELFDNLLDNAVRYSRDRGRITVQVHAEPAPSVWVNDDGPSIPHAERARVFERFHRLLGTSRDGSGLGLAIAQEIARIHGARIGLAEDSDGIGNSFRVTFPPAPETTLNARGRDAG